MSDEPKRSPNRKPVAVVLAVLGVIVVAVGSFFGGMAFQRYQRANLQQQFFADRGFTGGGLAPFAGAPMGDAGEFGDPNASGSEGPGRGAGGTVESVEGDILTLTGAQGDVTVRLTDDTVITVTAVGARSDLLPGAQVTVIGETDDRGTITAVAIQVQGVTP
jgi:hypothetical protein